jgi:hypothetical protein
MNAGNELAKAVKAVSQGKRYVSGRLKEVTQPDTEDTHAPDREVLAWPSATALPRKTETVRCHEAQFYSDDVIFSRDRYSLYRDRSTGRECGHCIRYETTPR